MSNSWLAVVRPAPDARLRLVCVPYLGAGPAVFSGWPAVLGAAVEVRAAVLPGRASRPGEPALTSIGAIAGGLAEAIAQDVTAPYALLGYSMGALVAYETARLLATGGATPPATLIVVAQAAPSVVRPATGGSAASDADVLERLRRYQGVPEAVMADAELSAILMPIIRADLRALESYRWQPGPPVRMPLLAVHAADDPMVTYPDMEAWRGATTESFVIQQVPGGHFAISTAPGPLLASVRAQLELVMSG
jgi:medium-chain acyl-[acyl-carrier-protein] hydrolase